MGSERSISANSEHEPDGQRGDSAGAGSEAPFEAGTEDFFLCPLGRGAVPAAVPGVPVGLGVHAGLAEAGGAARHAGDQHRILSPRHIHSESGRSGDPPTGGPCSTSGGSCRQNGSTGFSGHCFRCLACRRSHHGPLQRRTISPSAQKACGSSPFPERSLSGGLHRYALCDGGSPPPDLSALRPFRAGAGIHPRP